MECEYREALKDEKDDGQIGLQDYIRLLRIADFNDQAVDRASQNGWKRKETSMASDAGYERAIERLKELLEANPRLQQYLDKVYDFDTPNGNNGLCRHSVPRPTFHKRNVHDYAEFGGIPTLQDLKVNALQKAIEQSDNSVPLVEDSNSKASLEQNMKNFNSLLKLIRR